MKDKKEKKQTRLKNDALILECVDKFEGDLDNISTIQNEWEEKENLLIGKLDDSITSETNNRVNSPELLNSIYKRTSSTMAQLPTGKVQALSRSDEGKNVAMDLIFTKYVIPNAKTQYDMFTKAWFLQFYSYVYGNMTALVDYVVTDKYVGPDFYVLEQRNFIPQRKRYTIADMERCFVVSKVSRKWLEDRDMKNWKNIDKLLESVKGTKTSSVDSSAVSTTYDGAGDATKEDDEDIEIITRYECDRWVTFSKEAKIILRDVENLHKNEELPVVTKQAFPLIDRFYGLGEMERGMTLQYALNSLINLYLEGVKMSLFPPMKIYLPDVIASTINNEAGAKWVLKSPNPNAITSHQISPLGLNTFQSTYQFLKGALLGLAQTSDTSISQSLDPGMGKTPQALKMQEAFDSSRSNFDRKMLETALTDIFEKMVNLIPVKQEKPIKLNLFKQDLDLIAQYHPDMTEMFDSGKYGEVIIKPDVLRDGKKAVKYKFFLEAGTTARKDDQQEKEISDTILAQLKDFPGALEQAMQTGKVQMGNTVINVGELLKRSIIKSGADDPEKIVSELSPEEMQQIEMQKQQEAMMMQQQQMAQQPQQQMGGIQQPMQEQMPQANFEQPPAQEAFEGLSPESQAIMNELQGGQR